MGRRYVQKARTKVEPNRQDPRHRLVNVFGTVLQRFQEIVNHMELYCGAFSVSLLVRMGLKYSIVILRQTYLRKMNIAYEGSLLFLLKLPNFFPILYKRRKIVCNIVR